MAQKTSSGSQRCNLYDEENNRYDHYPTDMMKQGLIKRTHIDQVSNGTLAYEILISGDTYASLTYRSLRLPLYTEGATLDVNAKGRAAWNTRRNCHRRLHGRS